MEALLFAVGTGVLGTLIWWLGARIIRIRQRLRLRQFAFRQRRDTRRRLRQRLTGGSRRTLGRGQVDLLARSFRVKAGSPLDLPHLASRERLDAPRLLDHIEGQRGDSIYLVNADSGFGKTIFGLVLPLLRSTLSRRELFPCYLDLATADAARPLAKLDELLDRLGRREDIWGHPLIVFDAPNETVVPEHFAEELAGRRQELAAVQARLLFLFSFRHHSYPGRLRSALIDRGFDQLQNLELLFEIDKWTDLAFLPELIRARGGTPPEPVKLETDLREYAARFPTPRLSREEAACFLEWRYLEGGGDGPPSEAPSPAHLCLNRMLGPEPTPVEHLLPLARVAFHLLGREMTAASYRDIADHLAIGEDRLRSAIPRSGVDDLVHCGDQYLRFEDETTVRVLGAIEVARSLIDGRSPAPLRGRTIYDVCAPYVQPALSRLLQDRREPRTSPRALAGVVEETLHGSDAPYSFYAGVLCGEDTGVFDGRVRALDQALLHAMIAAIDEDRCQKCLKSLEATARDGSASALDPVLDQLFEVMATYDRRALPQLLPLMRDAEPLIKSQAAYLLLDRIQHVPEPLTPVDVLALRSVPVQMRGDDGNLHFRFHQVEVLERWLTLFPLSDDQLHRDGLSVLAEIASADGEAEGRKVYGELQALVCLRASRLVEPDSTSELAARFSTQLAGCLATLAQDAGFQGRTEEPIDEIGLECWEVALGMAAYSYASAPKSFWLLDFVERALEHDYWIVRWWAFWNLIAILGAACAQGHRVVAARCADRAVEQLYTAIEPMGLKHRQCAVIKRLRDGDDDAGQAVRNALAAATPPRATEPAGQALAERYYEAMGISPDDYLAEFFRRLDGLILLPS